MPDVNLAAIEMYNDHKPEIVTTNVEYSATADLVRVGINFPDIGKSLPCGVFGDAVPSP